MEQFNPKWQSNGSRIEVESKFKLNCIYNHRLKGVKSPLSPCPHN